MKPAALVTTRPVGTAAGEVPFLDLTPQHDEIRPQLDAAFRRVLERSQFILGPEVEAFEQEFARYCGVRHAVGVGNGLDALVLALDCLEIGRGDEVITVANTFFATALAIVRVGAKPVLVDCHPETLSIDVDQVAAAITHRTRAIIPVHLYGRLADMPALVRLADSLGLALIEDAAQAHGAMLDGKRAGAFGHLGCFSFYPTKNLGALGDGGAIVTSDADLAERLRMLRNYGSRVKDHHEIVGFNSRLDELEAAMLRPKLERLDDWNESRRLTAAHYRERLCELFSPDQLRMGALPRDPVFPLDHVHHLFPVLVPDRDRIRDALSRQGIGTGIHYPAPVHLAPAFAAHGFRPGQFPHAEAASQTILSLPLYPYLSDASIERVVEVLAATSIIS